MFLILWNQSCLYHIKGMAMSRLWIWIDIQFRVYWQAGGQQGNKLASSTAVFSRRCCNDGVLITGVADQCCSLEVVTQISKNEEGPECWVMGTLKQHLSSAVVQVLVSTINKTSTPCPETVDWILSSLGQCFSTSLSLLLYCPLLYFAFPETLGCWPSCIILSKLPQSCGITPGSPLPLCLFSEVLDGYW